MMTMFENYTTINLISIIRPVDLEHALTSRRRPKLFRYLVSRLKTMGLFGACVVDDPWIKVYAKVARTRCVRVNEQVEVQECL